MYRWIAARHSRMPIDAHYPAWWADAASPQASSACETRPASERCDLAFVVGTGAVTAVRVRRAAVAVVAAAVPGQVEVTATVPAGEAGGGSVSMRLRRAAARPLVGHLPASVQGRRNPAAGTKADSCAPPPHRRTHRESQHSTQPNVVIYL